PLFCSLADTNLTLHSDSPCLPANNPWGELIGALGEGCGPVTTWYVDNADTTDLEDGSQEYPFSAIGDGIAAATEGDTVLVAAGTYSGAKNRDLDFGGTNLVLLGEAGRDSTVIDCGGTDIEHHRGLILSSGEDSTSVVEGFTIKNAYADSGGAILCVDVDGSQLRHLALLDNYARGGGIFCDRSSVVIDSCLVTATPDADLHMQPGGGVYCDSSSVRMEHTTISGIVTSESHGAGVYCANSRLEMDDCSVSSNGIYYTGNGGGLYCTNSYIQMRDVFVQGNGIGEFIAGGGNGGGMCAVRCTLDVRDSGFGGNVMPFGNGGGLYCSSCTLTLENVGVGGNAAGPGFNEGWGGGLYASGCSGTIDSCSFGGNEASRGGAGAYGLGSGFSIASTSFSSNISLMGSGGGLNGSPASLTDVTFASNYADDWGGGMYGSSVFTNVTFRGNTAGSLNGGGLATGNATLTGCVFLENTAGLSDGSAIDCGGATTFSNCTFSSNYSGSAVLISSSASDVVIENTIIAFGSGRAVECWGEDAPTVSCCDIYGNSGGDWDGCIADQYGINGNISEDPLFCGQSGGVLTLRSDSPCAAGNSPGCGQIGAHGVGCAGEMPFITGISDVGNDEGRQVRLRWLRSMFDAPGDTVEVTGYGVYRRQDEYLRDLSIPVTGSDGTTSGCDGLRLDGWDYIGSAPAHGDSFYQMVAPSLCDSTEQHGICWSIFLVRAMTPQPLMYFDSAPDSGYSIDNLAPIPPDSLEGIFIPPGGSIWLTWSPSSSPDLQYYELHRGDSLDFTPSPINRIYADVDTCYMDSSMEWHESTYYKAAAVDFGGNRSEYAMLAALATGVPEILPPVSGIEQNYPNPFVPGARATMIGYSVRAPGGHVEISVFDVSGRLVRVLVDEIKEAGTHVVHWDGADSRGRVVSSGVYFYDIKAPGIREQRKAVVLR
ncbi:T9SS type A sorting domain-containing protein, partial [bacterium]|nr:T9SS type A sorting domain-containing protein [bacterium]